AVLQPSSCLASLPIASRPVVASLSTKGAAVLATLALIGCGSTDDGTSSNPSTPGTDNTLGGGGPSAVLAPGGPPGDSAGMNGVTPSVNPAQPTSSVQPANPVQPVNPAQPMSSGPTPSATVPATSGGVTPDPTPTQ